MAYYPQGTTVSEWPLIEEDEDKSGFFVVQPQHDPHSPHLALSPVSYQPLSCFDSSGPQNVFTGYHQHETPSSTVLSGVDANHPAVSAIPATQKTTRKHLDRSGKASSFPEHKGTTQVSSSGSHPRSPSNYPYNEMTVTSVVETRSTGAFISFFQDIFSPQPPRQRQHQVESTSAGSSTKNEARHRESSSGEKTHRSMGSTRRPDKKRNSRSTKSPDRSTEKAPDTKKFQSNSFEPSLGKKDAKELQQPTPAAQPERFNNLGSSFAHTEDGQRSSVFIDNRAIVQEPERYYRPKTRDKGQKDQQQIDPNQLVRTSREREDITTKYYRQKQKSAELEQEVANLEDENDTLRDLLSKEAASKNLMSGTGTGKCHLQDSDIYQQWRQLAWWIRQCVHVANNASKQNYTEGTTDRSRQVDDHKEKSSPKKRSSRSKSKSRRETAENESHSGNMEALIAITPYYDAFLDTDKKRIVLAEAAIWKTLLEKGIFTTRSTISRMEWAGRYAHSVRPMLADCFERCRTSREFHSWRCHTATFLASLTSADDLLVQANPVVEILKSKFKLIFDIESAVVNHDLKNIVLNAFKLDKQLCQQQALWYCDDPSEDAWASPTSCESGDELSSAALKLRSREVWFEDRLMVVTDAKKKKLGKSATVTLIICPALIKAGNSYGEDYDVRQVQAKCEVVISRNAPKLATSAPRSRPTSPSSSKVTLSPSAAPTSETQSRSKSWPARDNGYNHEQNASTRDEFDMSGNSSEGSDDRE
ncbi:hypothetical protein QR685DRAFT_516613 [Neurospora intermedia]|uniref:BZIP domain-containing protein n=1 Tax=Neurospora intermedia TaxID=5142 RepID=A0ABR3DL16_NEUIN